MVVEDVVDIPSTIDTLVFGSNFNKVIIPDTLPTSITSLTFGYEFSQAIMPGSLPDSLETLVLGVCFNQPLSVGSLPSSLRHLTFVNSFNQPLCPGVLPSSLYSLTFGADFVTPLMADVLPKSLKKLNLSYRYKQLDSSILPQGLTSLSAYDLKSPCTLPPTLIELNVGGGAIFGPDGQALALPPTLRTLYFLPTNLHVDPVKMFASLPPSLTSLTLEEGFIDPVTVASGYLPDTLDLLAEYNSANHPIAPGALPSHLTKLCFSYKFNSPIKPGTLPESLTELWFGYMYNSPMEPGSLPGRLVTLNLGNNYKRMIPPGVLSQTLSCITPGACMGADTPIAFPNNIKVLELGLNRVWRSNMISSKHLAIPISSASVQQSISSRSESMRSTQR
ncbi:hypothetical protein SAMD00019534_024020 [Acytostelium subglobosum LB1]|uniref:hypothetical protein n=1 Tax=Acytostelium subglobosum LB1 TaxID=1410327 RepID=UPI00064508DD|nr:hypothetical protein SAMD00019534_024020 [Acytostelium subglobosum LB1]GAM19227.1 hypothetical protein SAMD00019534_024020 [Acytostelium subglobosum LB1]|eukprot:XP_012757154.1 hypothetical protein SAMD00019534_024020 [Acytostelium subglobosum LB1]